MYCVNSFKIRPNEKNHKELAKVLYALIENPCTTDEPEKVTIRVMTEITRSSYPICHSLLSSPFYRLNTYTHTYIHFTSYEPTSLESLRSVCAPVVRIRDSLVGSGGWRETSLIKCFQTRCQIQSTENPVVRIWYIRLRLFANCN